MNSDPIATSVRRARRTTALNQIASDPDLAKACFLCGESRIFSLHSREGHHIAGRNNDSDLTGVVCLNCHAAIHEGMRAHGINLRSTNPLEALAALLASLGVLLSDIGSRLTEWARWLSELITSMGEHIEWLPDTYPGMRVTS